MKKSILSLLVFTIFSLLSNVSALKAQMYWNQAATFAGNSTSYISVPNSSSLNITGSFTLEAWVNPANTLNKGVIAKGGTLGTSLRYAVRFTSSRIVLITNGGPKLSSKTTSLIPVNTWTHFSAAFNSSTNEYKIFINGILDTSAVVAAPLPVSNTDSLYIGISGSSTPFNGKLDEVRVWNRSLSDTEINNYMRTSLETSSGKYNGLVLSMTFQNPVNLSPFTFYDYSGNSNNGNGRNVTQADQSYRPLHTISQNECLQFNGNNDYAAGEDTPALSPSPSLTMQCWFYPILDQPMTILKKGNSYEMFFDGSRVNAKLNGSNVSALGIPVPTNQWSFFIVSYDNSSGTLFFSLNGTIFGGATGSINIPVNTDSILIGGGIAENDFVGYIDEVRISDIAISREDFKDYLFTSIDVNNDPYISSTNVNYSFDGNLFDNANEGGSELHFRNNAGFSHPGQIAGQPVSPVNRNENESFQKGFYLRKPNLVLPSSGNTRDEVRINFDEPLTDVNLFVAMNHQNLTDLNIYLISPQGDSVKVFNNVSPNSSDNNLISIFDDDADSLQISSRYNSFYTTIKPFENFASVFNGNNPKGIWKLSINDFEAGNTGILYAWGIQINNHLERDKNFNMTCYLQGFYNPLTDLTIPDSIIVNIRKKYPPYEILETHKEKCDSAGMNRYSLIGTGPVIADSSYMVQILHRNSIESWVNGTITFINYENNLNTSTVIVTILGNNSIKVDNSPVRFAIYGGDVNQDGVVDASDAGAVDNDAAEFVTGYVNTDVTGDEVIDASDASIVDNNAANFVSAVLP